MMKLEMTPKNRLIVTVLALLALAVAFWMLVLSPKREEAKKLGVKVEALEASLSQHEAIVAEAEAAREEFPVQYEQLVVLGKAVPSDDDVASLLVQLNRISKRADGTLRQVELSGSGETESAEAPAPAATGEAPVSATEVEAALLPLGAGVGPGGLAVMPYEVAFNGNFLDVANFIKGLDSLVKTDDGGVVVDGRLVTVDGFSLEADPTKGFPALQATFMLRTYLTPPTDGTTAGAPPTSPSTTTAAPAATTTGVTP